MARFQFKLRSLLAPRRMRAAVSPRALPAPAPDDATERPKGPGWFDSSWDLTRGLEVREGLPGDAGLNDWLDVCLRYEPRKPTKRPAGRAGRGPRPASRPTPCRELDPFAAFGIDGLELA